MPSEDMIDSTLATIYFPELFKKVGLVRGADEAVKKLAKIAVEYEKAGHGRWGGNT